MKKGLCVFDDKVKFIYAIEKESWGNSLQCKKVITNFEKETHIKPPKRRISLTKLMYNTLLIPET